MFPTKSKGFQLSKRTYEEEFVHFLENRHDKVDLSGTKYGKEKDEPKEYVQTPGPESNSNIKEELSEFVVVKSTPMVVIKIEEDDTTEQ